MTNSTITKQPRIDFIDLAKGFCILLVIIYHYCSEDLGPDSSINIFLRTFRMPLYFILSGLFFKEYEGLLGFIKRKINKLLIPLFFFFAISALLFLIIHDNWDSINYLTVLSTGLWKEDIVGNMPLWFLWCLFVNNILFYIIIITTKNRPYPIWTLIGICCLCGIIGFFLGYRHIELPMFLDTALTTTPFFAFGYLLRKYTKILYENKYDKYLVLQTIAYFLIVALLMRKSNLYTNNMQQCNIASLYICGIAGSLGVLSLAKIFHRIPVISYLGRYSIIILCTHMIPILFLHQINPLRLKIGLDSALIFHILLVLIVLILEYLIIIPLLKKYLPYFTAQKDLIPITPKSQKI